MKPWAWVQAATGQGGTELKRGQSAAGLCFHP